MLDPLATKYRYLFVRLHRTKAVTRGILLWEELVERLWRVFIWIVLFCGIWLFKIPGLFEDTGYIAANIIFLSGVFYLILSDVRRFHWPDDQQVYRRIEIASALKHRPLSAINDTLFDDQKPETRKLWDARIPSIFEALRKIRSPWPRPILTGQDKRGLRFIAVLLALTGFWIAGPEWSERIHHGLVPYGWVDQAADMPDILATITPPDYTQVAQTTLQASSGSEHSMDIQQGSKIQIKMLSRFGAPHLMMGDQNLEFDDIGNQNYAIEVEVPQGEQLQVRQFWMRAFTLNYNFIPDTAPQISLQEGAEVAALPDAQVQIPLLVKDDYGVESVRLRMNLDPIVEDAPIGWAQEETRSVMSPAGMDFKLSPVYDFTANPWAGLPVVFNITATDMLGQSTELEPIHFTLPERDFKHPIALELVELRKRLAWSPVDDMIPVSDALIELLQYPEDFQDDPVVYLALTSASSRLVYGYQSRYLKTDALKAMNKDTKEVMALLWDTALRIEDGNLTLAARNLRQAQSALENALMDENMSAEDIARLMHNLKQAMGEYLSELAKELQKRLAEGEDIPMLSPEALAQMIDPEVLGSFMDQMENEMLSGNTRQAQDMLSQLQRMLDLLNPNMAAPMPMDMMTMMDSVSEMEQLIEKQEKLKDQTQEQAKKLEELTIERDYGEHMSPNLELLQKWGLIEMPPPPEDKQSYTLPGVDTQNNKAEQEALRFILGQLMLDADAVLDKIPEKMGMAEREMLSSSEYLGQNKPGESVPHQDKAIEYLKDAQNEMSKQLQERMQEMMGQGAPLMGQGAPQRRDPLGRPLDGGQDEGNRPFSPNSQVKIPDEAERKRVQETLRILREKSGELSRSKEELDYFRRLLKQF